MATDENFDLFHKYNRLVRRSLAKPVRCKACTGTLTTSLGKDDELNLVCFTCDYEIVPGTTLMNQIRAVVKEHYA